MKKQFKTLNNIKKIHMIGIGGTSMSGIALILKKEGYTVTGSDKFHGDMIDILEKNGIPVAIGSHAELVKDADIVVYTSAINQHDPEFVRAKSLGIPTYERAKFLEINENQKDRIEEIRNLFSEMYNLVEEICKPSRETSLVFTKLEEAQFWAIKGISREVE